MASVLRAPRSPLLASAPPLVALAVASVWCGTFDGGASAAGRLVLASTVLGLGLLGAHSWRDPLGVGGVLPAALVLSVFASFLASPVRRVGLEAVLLLPAFGLAVAATARSWREPAAQRWAARGISLLLLGASIWSLLDWGVRSIPGTNDELARAAMPLGHHNLLAAWLVGLLPLACLPLRQGGWWRAVGAVALALGGSALVLSRSLSGLVVGSIELLIWAWRRPAGKRSASGRVVALVLALVLAWSSPRLVTVAALEDPSLHVRLGYAEGALRGTAERPALGWGPGATRWTLGRFLAAAPGWRPAGEIVTDPHSLPLELAYDLGASGSLLALALVALFVWRRLHEPETTSEGREQRSAALLGLFGLGLMSVVGRPLSAAALPLVAVVLAGASLAASPPPSTGRPWPVWIYSVVVVALLARPSIAAFEYERGMGAASDTASLQRAVSLDPAFPLYRLHRALGLASAEPGSSSAAHEAALAAQRAGGLAPLWLAAGLLALDAGDPFAAEGLERACRLDPLGALAPFALMATGGEPELLAEWGARSILADPVLGAAVYWDQRPVRFAEVTDRIERWPGVPEEWRGELQAKLRRLEKRRRRGRAAGRERVVWSLEVNGRPSTALSLHAFRRASWPFELGAVELDAAAAARLSLPGADQLRATHPDAFPRAGCAAPAEKLGRRGLLKSPPGDG